MNLKMLQNDVETKNDSRIGVFLCECGGKISSKVHLESLQENLARDPSMA